MYRYIRSDQYIPDMTERFPEGMRGYDETEPEGYEPDYAEWEAEHYSDLVKEIRRYQDMTQEEFDALAEDDRQRYYDLEEELRENDDSDGSAWERRWEVPEVDDSIMITQGYVGDNYTGETVGSYGEFTYGGYWVHTSKNEAHFDTADEIDDYLNEKGLHRENSL